jgi:hypothetical protein
VPSVFLAQNFTEVFLILHFLRCIIQWCVLTSVAGFAVYIGDAYLTSLEESNGCVPSDGSECEVLDAEKGYTQFNDSDLDSRRKSMRITDGGFSAACC